MKASVAYSLETEQGTSKNHMRQSLRHRLTECGTKMKQQEGAK